MNASELKFKKMGTAQLLTKVDKLIGEEKTACIEVLKSRGQNVSKWDVTASVSPVVNSAQVYEVEPEGELTSEEAAILAAAEKKSSKPSKVKKSKAVKEKVVKATKLTPKAMEILALLKAGVSKYAIAKQLNTYYSVVAHIAKRHLPSVQVVSEVSASETTEITQE